MRRDFETLSEIIQNTIGDPLFGCELGVAKGGLSRRFLTEFDQLHLLMVDHWETYNQGPRTRATVTTQEDMYDFMLEAVKVTMFASNRRIIMVGRSVEVSHLVKDESLDFVFLDANHFYKSVLADLNSWYSKIRTDGLMCGHDYNAKREREGGYWGVKKAVDEFAEMYGYKVCTAPYNMWWYEK